MVMMPPSRHRRRAFCAAAKNSSRLMPRKKRRLAHQRPFARDLKRMPKLGVKATRLRQLKFHGEPKSVIYHASSTSMQILQSLSLHQDENVEIIHSTLWAGLPGAGGFCGFAALGGGDGTSTASGFSVELALSGGMLDFGSFTQGIRRQIFRAGFSIGSIARISHGNFRQPRRSVTD